MKNDQIHQFNSFRARRTVLSDQTATSLRPAFTPALAALDTQLTEVDQLTLAQGQSVPVRIVERTEALAAMREMALSLAASATSYADDQGLAALALQVQLKPTDFDRVRLDRRVPVARHLLDALDPIVAQLADYGVTPADLADFKKKIDAAETALAAPRDTVVGRKAATARLSTALRKAGAIFRRRIDPLVRSVRESNPDFHARYQAARKVVSRTGSHAAPPPAITPAVTPPSSAS